MDIAKSFGLWLGDNLKKNKGKNIDELWEEFLPTYSFSNEVGEHLNVQEKARLVELLVNDRKVDEVAELSDLLLKDQKACHRKAVPRYPHPHSNRDWLHNHFGMENALGVDEYHVIVDKNDWEEARNLNTKRAIAKKLTDGECSLCGDKNVDETNICEDCKNH